MWTIIDGAAARIAGATSIVVLSAGTMVACSGSDEPEQTAGSAEAASGDESSENFPVTIEHQYGETVIPEAPERVVSLGSSDGDYVLQFGGDLVGNSGFVFYDDGLGPWMDDFIDGDRPVALDFQEVDVELIASLEPDIIVSVTGSLEEEIYEQFSEIAPTLAPIEGAKDRQEVITALAAAMGQSEQGEILAEETDQLIQEAAHDHPEFADSTVTVVLPDPSFGYWAYLEGDQRTGFFQDLGFGLTEEVQEAGESAEEGSPWVQVAHENVDLLESDILIVLVNPEDQDFDITEVTPLATSLDVVQNDAVIVLDVDERGAISYDSPLSIPYALDTLVPRLSEALDS